MTDELTPSPGAGGVEGGLARTAAAGAVWSIAQNLLTRVTAFVTVLILARLLSPADFGIVTIAATLIPILQVLADLGITMYVLQHPAPTKLIYHTYFWVSSSIALVGGGVLFFAAPLVAQLFGEPSAGPVMQGLAPTALLVTLGAVPQTILRRGLRFQAIAVQGAIAAVVSQAVAVTAAFAGLGVWSLVLQTLTLQFLATLLAWVVARYRPSFQFSGAELKQMVRFGGNYVVSTGIQTAAQLLINFIITSVLGVAALGYLNIVQRLIRVVTDVVLSAVLQVSTVAFAMIRDSAERLRSGYLRSFSTLYTLLVPVMVFIAASATHLVPFMYGNQWGPSIAPGEVLAVTAIFFIDSLDHALYAGIGRPVLWTRYALYSSVVLVAATWIGSYGGLLGVVWAGLVGEGIVTFIRWSVTSGQIRASRWALAGAFARVGVPGAMAAGAGYLVAWLTAGLPDLVGVILVWIAVVAVYLPIFRFTARSTWLELEGLLRHGMRRIFRRGAATPS
ncbi:lipopolysaccharide biosynthesis protein [Lysinimonas soli]|uniref:Lipopolysaccharide biosynthesis protein n=1 Tax=Lysinimonas soli TaxID=1074233 RepID=A0ABW0NK88_9MICO